MTNPTTTPLTDLQLDEIAGRTAGLYEYATGLDDAWQAEADQLTGTDVPALLAELRRHRAEAERHTEDLASADNPTPLRWGLHDVLWGDDDTVTVLLSGPDREPYRLELDPERAAVLRQDLAGADGAETDDEPAPSTRACGHDDYHDPHEWADRPGVWCPGHSLTADEAPESQAEACGKCKRPFDPDDTRFDGHARYHLTPYCRACVDLCHDNEIADHRCVICA